MTLRVPVTASSVPEWVRLSANAINSLIGHEANPVAASITLTPGALPASPVKGQTVYDVADDIVKTWNGSAWKSHY